MVTGAESVANDCQQKKSQIMARLYQNHISKCTINIKKKDSSGLSKITATRISSAVLMRRFLARRTKVNSFFEHFLHLG